MRFISLMTCGALVASLVAACSSSAPTGPVGNPLPPGGGGGPPPASGDIVVGNIFFRSGADGSVNPAVTTVAAGTTVIWTWANNGGVPHSVQSVGTPSFPSSAIQSASGATYRVTFNTPGTYRYNCAVHGDAMSGMVVVQ